MNLAIFKDITSMDGRKSNVQAAVVACGHLAAYFLVGVIADAAISTSKIIGIPALWLAIVFIGTRFRAVNNMSHECLHGTYAKSRSVNEFFGHIFAIVELSSFLTVRREHFTHHRHLGNFDLDMDFRHLEKFGFDAPMDATAWRTHLKNALLFRHFGTYFFVVLFDRTEPLWAQIARTAYVVLLIASFIRWPIGVTLYVIVPFLTSYQIQKYLTDFLDHGGLLLNQDAIYKTRNFVIQNPLLRSIFFPRTDCYHLVHHLFPSLCIERLSTAHRRLMDDPKYARIPHLAGEQIAQWIKTP